MLAHEEPKELRKLMKAFLYERLTSKLDELDPSDPKREKISSQFEFDTWVADAARRVSEVQVVTHSLKPLHPYAKGSCLYVSPTTLTAHELLGSHVLSEDFDRDVVSTTARHLDVYQFLKLIYRGCSLLARVLVGDPVLREALSDNPEQAGEWMRAFATITQPGDQHASHSHAKQLYWLAGDEPTIDSHFHLLAPLYATSLTHKIYKEINEDLFGKPTEEGREALRRKCYSEMGYRDYPGIVVQKLGGDNPQNISQLNSERGGKNYLLASLPPAWVSSDIKPPFFVESVFERFGQRRPVRETLRGLRKLLRLNPAANKYTRDRRDEFLGALIDELVLFASSYSVLEPGWSASLDCHLVEAEALWLDPWRDDDDFAQRRESEEWTEEVRHRFANWLNKQLSKELPVDDAAYAYWKKFLKQLHDLKQMHALQEILPYV